MTTDNQQRRISPLSRTDLSGFKPKTVEEVKAAVSAPAATKEVAAKNSFTSRSSVGSRRQRTGRTEQCNIKCTADYKAKFHQTVNDLKEQRIRGDAETFEFLIDFYQSHKDK